MKVKKNFIVLLLVIAFIFAMSISAAAEADINTSAKKEDTVLSVGLRIIAAENGMAKAGLKGKELSFSADDFKRALNIGTLSAITVKALPDQADGSLYVGTTPVSEGQTISYSNISLLSYVPGNNKAGSGSFVFTTGEGYDMTCDIYMLDTINHSPTTQVASELSLSVYTYSNISTVGVLDGYDPEGDELVFEIVSTAKKGAVVMSDMKKGEYEYTPGGNFSGTDSFKYVVRDKYGNYSAAATVTLTVDKYNGKEVYIDLVDGRYTVAAMKMSEKGVMGGMQIGNGCYFSPEEKVSRAEFVVMAMKALGIKVDSSLVDSGFYDDKDIPSAMRSHIATAKKYGYISGVDKDGNNCFMPDDPITREDAALIIDTMMDADKYIKQGTGVLAVFYDENAADEKSIDSLYTLNTLSILRSENGKIMPDATLKRGEVANILFGAMRLASED